MTRARGAALACLLLAASSMCVAQDANITAPAAELERMMREQPFVIAAAEISRPKAKGDITLKAEVAFGDQPPLRVKLRKAEPGADSFNNVPRYDLAAYELQKLFLDPAEYVVPPTALRMVPLDEFRRYSKEVKATFPGADEVLAVMQYWLHDIAVVADVLDPVAFETDPVYARHIGQLNLLTCLINHRDSNAGNFLIGKGRPGARVFSIDNGVAFGSQDSDRGMLWRDLRVKRLPADAIARLRPLTRDMLQARLGVLAQWELREGHYVAVALGENAAQTRGVRRSHGTVQMGLTRSEIGDVFERLQGILSRVDTGEISTF